ncbi:hypothetical protein GCM10009682_19880 [Luedemannella flava]|uniref:Uncharacterized protein n=1 Tax=Luedemannella flava TaxID=349316 RepID=A0ABN2LSF4_9ACTN
MTVSPCEWRRDGVTCRWRILRIENQNSQYIPKVFPLLSNKNPRSRLLDTEKWTCGTYFDHSYPQSAPGPVQLGGRGPTAARRPPRRRRPRPPAHSVRSPALDTWFPAETLTHEIPHPEVREPFRAELRPTPLDLYEEEAPLSAPTCDRLGHTYVRLTRLRRRSHNGGAGGMARPAA